MKKTFTTTLPDQIGAFLQADKALSLLNVNITRVSYNKAVDTHMLFIEVEGEENMLHQAEESLSALGYLSADKQTGSVILLEFRLKDEPRRLLPILEVIDRFGFNITYLSSEQTESLYQNFKIGIFVDDSEALSTFIQEASLLAPVKILNYDKSEKILDHTVFYLSFANSIAEKMSLSDNEKQGLIICANRIMQTLDERNSPFYKTFDYISRLADHIEKHKGNAFSCRVTKSETAKGRPFVLIEPPCGSNLFVAEENGGYLMVDSSFACYREEWKREVRKLYPEWRSKKTDLLLTHSDVDHAGSLDGMRKVYLTKTAALDFEKERSGENAYREENTLHQPYAYISKILTNYRPPKGDNFVVLDKKTKANFDVKESMTSPLCFLGTIQSRGFTFQVYEGLGGHVKGEAVFLEYEHRIAFSGDIFVNVKNFTKEQKAFNKLAPYLMTSVDTDPALAKKEREAFFALLTQGEWQIIGGHGGIYTVTIE